MKLFKICKEFFSKILSKKRKIPLIIEGNEILVRCIGHDLYYSRSKQRLSSTAFMPPPGSNEISLLRLNFMDVNSCKKHAKSIKKNNYTYCGLSITKTLDFNESPIKCSANTLKYSDGKPVTTKILATPLDENKKKRKDLEIFVTDLGLPAHADLLYNWTPVKGKSAPNPIKKIAKYLSNLRPHISLIAM